MLFLADVFDSFRRKNDKNYGLDSAKYLSPASFSFDTLLKSSKIKWGGMYTFMTSSIHGRISVASKKYANANIPSVKGYTILISPRVLKYI